MDESPQAHDELTRIFRDALPDAWRHAVEVTRSLDGFELRFRDAEGRQHALDALTRSRAPTATLMGKALGYSYTIVDPGVDEAAVLDEYRAVMAALAARERELLPWFRRPDVPGKSHNGAVLPVDFRQMREFILGCDDDNIYEGIWLVGLDDIIAHVVGKLLPDAALGEGDALGTVQFVIQTPHSEHDIWVARRGAKVEAGVGRVDGAQASATVTLPDFLRLFVNEPGKDAATQMSTGSLRVTGDEALVRAFPGWFRLPT